MKPAATPQCRMNPPPAAGGPRRLHPASPGVALHGTPATRALETAALARHPPGTLMARAGLAVARLALALRPGLCRAWVLAGPGQNGGDGLVAATALAAQGVSVWVFRSAPGVRPPGDAGAAWDAAQALATTHPRLRLDADPPPDAAPDLIIDALFGIGLTRAPQGAAAALITRATAAGAPVLAVDVPSGLDADTGQPLGETDDAVLRATWTLTLLTAKPGLFTGQGRALAGEVWLDDLGCAEAHADDGPALRLTGRDDVRAALPARGPVAHKGSFGDVLVVGGAPGMVGALWLAARGAAAAGAGRVRACPLDPAAPPLDAQWPELMRADRALLTTPGAWADQVVAAGCGGGTAIAADLPALLHHARRLVLDADALNAIAADATLAARLRARSAHGHATVLTPHPLEAARLAGRTTAQVQADRVGAARALARDLGAVVLLKGSGTVIARPDGAARLTPTGDARLATGGTGDVLCGLIAGLWAAAGDGGSPFELAAAAAWLHGHAARQVDAPSVRAAELLDAVRAAVGAPG
jgi:ADP-dependent NAD(P)H-hydrate dehydratase / NAD(P)H-hydrate epimerase